MGLKDKNFYSNLPFLPQYIKDDMISKLEGKYYVPCIKKKEGFNPKLRIHVKGQNGKISSVIYEGCEENKINPHSIKDKFGLCTIELNNIWIHNDSYGVTWFLDSCNIK